MVRLATADDAGIVARHRALMFHEMGVLPMELMDALRVATQERLPEMIRAGTYRGWLAEDAESGAVVAGVGLQLRMVLPRPTQLAPGVTRITDREGILLNAYTEPTHRRRGLARALVTEAVAWTQDNGVGRVVLHASAQGRSLYEQLGFVASNEMRYVAPT